MLRLSVLLLVVAAACLMVSQAQLTFTSSWGGKRSGLMTGRLNCRNEEAIANIYRMIQNEAEKFLLCQKP